MTMSNAETEEAANVSWLKFWGEKGKQDCLTALEPVLRSGRKIDLAFALASRIIEGRK